MKATTICAIALTLAVFYYSTGISKKDSSSKRNTSATSPAGFLDFADILNEEENPFVNKVLPAITTEVVKEEEKSENYFQGLKTLLKGQTKRNDVNLLILGDFGYLSGKQHSGTLELADFVVNRINNTFLEYDFVVSVGDVLYDFGVESFDDPNPGILFEEVFKMSQLGLDWYSVLGNHDCMGNLPATYALADKFSLWKQSESYYSKIFNIGNTNSKAGFVFLNGCELVCLTHDSSECYRGTLKNINFDILQDQVDWFENILSEMAKEESIVWKVVVVHNGVFSAGISHGDNPDLKRAILPLLIKYKVDVVLSGHDHNVQYLRMGLDLDEVQDKKAAKEVKCPEGIEKDECIFGEFFHSELTECGIIKKDMNQVQSLFQKNGVPGAQRKRVSRDTFSNQYEYLHQFIIGNGGTKSQKMCPYRQKNSQGNLRYGNTALGLAEMKIQEDKLELNLITTKDEVLYSVKILRPNNDDGEL